MLGNVGPRLPACLAGKTGKESVVTLWIGTSGWQYDDWRGVLYPDGLAQRKWLSHYADRFRCVEVNNAFYRLPERDTFAKWRDQTPDGFLMAVKVSRYLTHIKRMQDPEEPVARLLDRAEGLGDRLGPFLLQLPPNLRADPARLDACLAAFPKAMRVAVEPRHETWWTDEVRDVLARRNAALCWADRQGPVTPTWVTADWGYLRFHEGRATPRPSYGRQALKTWRDRIGDSWPRKADIFVFFNNDPGGAAVRNADTFSRLDGRPA